MPTERESGMMTPKQMLKGSDIIVAALTLAILFTAFSTGRKLGQAEVSVSRPTITAGYSTTSCEK